MKILVATVIMFSLGCQTIREQQQKDAKERVQKAREKLEKLEGAPKVDPTKLTVSLTVEPYIKGNVKGALLIPNLDPWANYMFYSACSLSSEARPCVEGSITGLTPETKYDFPPGRVKVTYKACVIAERSARAGTNCSKEAWTYFNQTGENPPEVLQLLLTEQRLSDQIQDKALETRQALQNYKNSTEGFGLTAETEDFDTLVDNQLNMDPYVIGAFYDSEDMDSYMQTMNGAVQQQQEGLQLAENAPVVATGASLVALGSVGLVVTLWTNWAATTGRSWGGVEGKARAGVAKTAERVKNLWQLAQGKEPAQADTRAAVSDATADLKTKIGDFSSAWTDAVGGAFGVKGAKKSTSRAKTVASGAIKGAIASAAVIAVGIIIQVVGQLALSEDDPKRTLVQDLDQIGAELARLKQQKAEVSQQLGS